MRRVLILIGVSSPTDLMPLPGVESCIAAMRDWALKQRIDTPQVIEITDLDDTPVTLARITEVIFRLEEEGAVDQIIVYFAGHGLIGAGGDLWFLTAAPRDRSAVVSLDATRKDALRSSFSHTVLISDACRVAAQGVQKISLVGNSIFPDPSDGPKKMQQVDQFFASTVGEPAFEVKRSQGFVSIYTEALSQALGGGIASLLEEETPGTPTPVVVRPWPLADHLPMAVASWLESNHLALAPETDAVIGSRPTAWLAEFDILPPALPEDGSPMLPPGDEPGEPDIPKKASPNIYPPLAVNTSTALRNNLRDAASPRLLDRLPRMSPPPGRRSALFGAHCGFRVQGSYFTGAWSTPGSRIESSNTDVHVAADGPVGVVLRFASGQGAFLPALAGFVGYVRVDASGMIRSVLYEPSPKGRTAVGQYRFGSPAWRAFNLRAPAVRRVRAVLDTASTSGHLRMGSLGGIDQQELLKGISYRAGVDLTSAVLAAYGLYGAPDQEIIPELINRVRAVYHYVPADLLMLGSSAREGSPRNRLQVDRPPFPMLTRGWSLMRGFGLELPLELAGLELHLSASPWTLVDAEGVEMLHHYVTRVMIPMSRIEMTERGTTNA